jgi:hypothetical protein
VYCGAVVPRIKHGLQQPNTSARVAAVAVLLKMIMESTVASALVTQSHNPVLQPAMDYLFHQRPRHAASDSSLRHCTSN